MRVESRFVLGFLLFLSAGTVYADPILTLNKTHKPSIPGSHPATTFALGEPITYVITVSNSGTLNNHISVTDTVPSGFVFVNAKCTPEDGATCPGGTPQPPVFGEFSIPNNGKVTIEMTGYFTTIGSKTNRAVAVARDDQGNPFPPGIANMAQDSVSVDAAVLPVDLKIEKCVGPGSACGSTSTASFPANLHYAITVTNLTPNQDVYLGGLMTVRDHLSRNNSTLPVSYSLSNYTCTPSSADVACPDPPSPASGALFAQILFRYDAPGESSMNDKGFLPGGASYRIELDAALSTSASCKTGSLVISNQAFLSLSNGVQSVNDLNSGNNTSVTTSTSITGGLPPECPPAPAGVVADKIKLSPPGNVVNWSSPSLPVPVRYRITLTNPSTGADLKDVFLKDSISKAPGTPVFKATVTSGPTICMSGSVCPDLKNVMLKNPTVNTDFSFDLWTAELPSLARSQTVVIEYEVEYVPVCESDSRPNRITNEFRGADTFDQVTTSHPEASTCELGVEKTKLTAGPIVFGQPFTYEVAFSNLSATAVDVGTVRDVLSIASTRYGSFLFDYSVSCNATAGTVVPVPGPRNVPGAVASQQAFGWRGVRLIEEALSFGPGSTLTCTVTITAKQPTDSNTFCQGAGTPQLINSAYMDLSRNYNDNISQQQPVFYDSEAADLPLCRNLIVTKTANGQNFGPGAAVVYTITVVNKGDDPVSFFTLRDVIQPPLLPVSVAACVPASCITGPALSGNQVNVEYGLLTPEVPVSFDLTVMAPQAGGSYPNLAQGAFLPGGNFYFRGDAESFLQQEENIQVVTPTMTKSFDLGTIGPNGTATLAFTVTNTNGDPQQNGMAFSDTLSPGLLAGSVLSNGCGGMASLSADGRVISLTNGQLAAGNHTCQISVMVRSTGVCGILLNNRSNFSGVTNLDVSGINAQLEVAGAACAPSEDVDVSLVTGWDETANTRLPRGAADDDWTVSVGGGAAQPARLVSQPPAVWPRFRPSEWISATNSGASQPGAATVRFERCFCIAAGATNAKLTMSVRADDQATVLLNGVPIAGPGGQFRRVQPLSVLYSGAVGSSLFQAGNNCVAVVVDDLRQLFAGLDTAGTVWIDHGKCDGVTY